MDRTDREAQESLTRKGLIQVMVDIKQELYAFAVIKKDA